VKKAERRDTKGSATTKMKARNIGTMVVSVICINFPGKLTSIKQTPLLSLVKAIRRNINDSEAMFLAFYKKKRV
jgi:hypothetical protein